MARLHMVDWRAVGLENFGKPAGYLGRQISLWTRQLRGGKDARHSGHGRTDRLASAHMPADDTTTIAHGDFPVVENLHVPSDRSPRVIGVLDWGNWRRWGIRFADVAYNCMIWHLDPGDA